MEWLNYHHLLYFWTVARTGSIARASKELRLAQPTVSGQIKALEETLGEKLFTRAGRGLAMTDVGQTVYQYADEIFSLGKELTGVLKGRPRGRPLRFTVGVADVVPKFLSHRILQPALNMAEPVRLVCHEDKPDRLLADLPAHGLDMVLTDAPLNAAVRVRAFNHLLGSCGVVLYAEPRLAAKYRDGFPASLDGAPFLLPTEACTLRRSLEQWFEANRIRPIVIGEFQDSALLKTFGQAGTGVFAVHSAIEKQVQETYRVSPVGRIESIVERFYAISVERRLKHPAVVAISQAARHSLFASGAGAASG